MKVGRGRKAVSVVFVASFATGGLVMLSESVAEAATFVNPPEFLYMAPAGTSFATLPVPYPLLDVPIGTMKFDGATDPITQDVRTIEVDTVDGNAGCDLSDQPVGIEDYDIDDCSRVQLDVGNGDLFLGAITTRHRDFLTDPDGPGGFDPGDENPADPVYQLPSGAVVDNPYQDPVRGSGVIGMNGTEQQLNDALAAMVYTPDDDYHYDGSDREFFTLLLVPGNSDDPPPTPDPTDTAQITVEIRVLDVNDWVTIDGPNSDKSAQPETELMMDDQFTLADEDNDEIIDGNQADPPVAEEQYADGEDDEMLLIGWLTCSQPTVDNQTGFHYQGGIFEADAADIEDLLTDFYDPSSNPETETYVQTAIDAIVAALEAIEPGITTAPLATNDPFDFTHIFAGISDIEEVQYALAKLTFLHNTPGTTCTLTTIVSDLGNNGLPLQHIGTPPDDFEVPFVGADFNTFDINVGQPETVDASFVPGSIFVGEPGTATATIDIEPDTHPAFDLRWSTQDGTATDVDDDYQPITDLTITIPQDAPTFTIDSNAFGDLDPEGNENYTLMLTTPTDPPPGPFVRPLGWVVTSNLPIQNVIIVDDDDADRTLTSVSDPTVTEGDAGTKNLTFTLTLDGPADGTESVDVDTVDDSATVADNDYVALSDSVTFAPGATTATVDVVVNGDLDDEPDETMNLQLSNANITLNDSLAQGTITNDDDPRTVTAVSAPTIPEGNSATSPMTFTITVDNLAKAGDSVRVNTSGATEGVDYVDLVDQIVPLTPGQLTTTVNVLVNGDTTIEGDEIVTLSLDQPSPGVVLGVSSGTGTIQNDDGIPQVSVDDVTVKEGDAPSTIIASFTVSLTDPAVGGETITVDAAGVTAAEGVDFASFAPQVLTFVAGETEKVVDVTVNGDDDAEPDELFVLNLSLPTGLSVVDSAGVGTITNDDILVTVPSTATTTEGTAAVLSLTIEPAGHPAVNLLLNTTPGTASGVTDYSEASNQAVLVPVAAPTVPVAIPTVQDSAYELAETFTAAVTAGAPTPGFTVRFVGGAATVTINDDDPQPLMSIADVNVVEGDTAQLTVSLANASHDCTVDFATGDGSATIAGNDYTANSGTVPLNGIPSATIDVATTDDPDVEGAETFTVTLTAPGGDPFCGLGDAVATVTIIDNDDLAPTLSIADASVTEGTGVGTTTISFDVMTSGVQPSDCGYRVVLTHDASNGTSDADFMAPATFDQTATFLTTDLTVARDFDVNRDAVDEPDETFTLTITGDGGTPCAIGDGTATGTIIDDDAPAQDTTPPDVTVTLVGANPTSALSIDFTVSFTEDVTGFLAGDVDFGGTALPTNAQLSVVDAKTYTVTVTGMSVSGTVTVSVAADTAQDLAGNANTASNLASVQWNMPVVQDTASPTVTVTPGVASPTSNSPIPFTIQFSEPVTGLIAADVALTAPAGAALTLVPVDADTYTVSVGNLLASGIVSVSVPAGAAQDLALNDSVGSNTATVEFMLSQGALALDLPSDIVRNNDPGQAGAVVTFNASASGGAPPVVVVCAPASGSLFPIGTTTVSCTATDADEGLDQAIVAGTFTVQVVDNEPPTITDLPDLTRTTTDTTPVAVTFPLPAASDNSGVAPTVVCSPLSGTGFQVGVSTVTCTATDGAGLTASSSFTVTVTSTPSAPPTPTPGALPPTGSSIGIARAAAILVAAGAALLLLGVRRRRSSTIEP